MISYASSAALAAALALSAGQALAATPLDGPISTVRQFVDGFNIGNTAQAAAAYASTAVIIDEPPPHVWTGAHAFEDWSASLAAESKSEGDTQERVQLGKVLASHVEAGTAYVSLRSAYYYHEHGRAMIEPATMTFALVRQGGAWKITGWSWNATMPHPQAPVHKAPQAKAPPAKPKT